MSSTGQNRQPNVSLLQQQQKFWVLSHSGNINQTIGTTEVDLTSLFGKLPSTMQGIPPVSYNATNQAFKWDGHADTNYQGFNFTIALTLTGTVSWTNAASEFEFRLRRADGTLIRRYPYVKNSGVTTVLDGIQIVLIDSFIGSGGFDSSQIAGGNRIGLVKTDGNNMVLSGQQLFRIKLD